MRLMSFKLRGRDSWGVVRGEAVSDCVHLYPTLRAFIASPDFPRREQLMHATGPDYPLERVEFRPVIPDPEKIVCLVRNYLDHHQEIVASGLQREVATFPPIFLRYARTQVGHRQPIIRPVVSDSLDWEVELAVIIGRGGRHIKEADAMAHVAGYAVYNDASVREYQFHAKQIAAGKNFDGTGSFGPWMVTVDEVSDPHDLNLQTRLNGVVMQSSNTKHMIFKIPQIIEYASRIFELLPGDVLVTGTPSGVGFSRNPPVYMKNGDLVEVEVDRVGLLRNSIVDEVMPSVGACS
jgi:2-keto-4-pentenoate hydratase/2-oxohepta-3-ene-1,7-dioic acid hydratase in catechol pathway